MLRYSLRRIFKESKFISKFSTSQNALSNTEISTHNLYTDDHRAVQSTLLKIIENDINPHVDQWEADEIFPAHKIFKTLGSAGYLGVDKHTKYGGMGLDYTFNIAVAEQLGSIKCGGVPMAIGVQSDMTTTALDGFGSEELKQEFLIPTISGDKVACLGVSEVQAGSDVARTKTTARVDGDDLIIDGSKMWTTNGLQADWMCLLANTSDGPPHRNKSLICLPLDLPGVTRQKIRKIGMHSSDTAQMFFDGVRIPKKYIIGEEGMGFTYQMLQFQKERLFGVAVILNPLEDLIRDTAEYARNRIIFNKPLLDHQVIHFRLAELQTELECLRSLLYRAVAKMVFDGENVTMMASMGKLKAGRLAREVTDTCLQYWGGMGYTNDVLVSRYYRDMRLLSIGGGADEVMLSIICKFMNTLPK